MTKHKALFISDIHLGKRSPKIKELLNFLQNKEFEKIFLVGDIFDAWELLYNWKWENVQLTVLWMGVFTLLPHSTRTTSDQVKPIYGWTLFQ